MAAERELCSSSSSSEEEEELQRLREASWNPQEDFQRRKVPIAELSLREKSGGRDQKGKALQTTPEFQAHVAKKLRVLLDSSISILDHTSGPAQNSQRDSEVDDGDVGFRLFSSSISGSCAKSESAPLGRKRQHRSSSSEDSDVEWQRCREAAVSAADILRLSGFPEALQNSGTDHTFQATEVTQKKRRRRKKATMDKAYSKESDEEEAVETVQNVQIGDRSERPVRRDGSCKKEWSVGGEDQEGLIVKKKKKKRRKQERTDWEPHL